MKQRRPIHPGLRSIVRVLWATGPTAAGAFERERVLPTGAMHIVLRLADSPLRVFRDEDDRSGDVLGVAIVGGTRTTAYLRDVSEPVPAVGAQLVPGAARFLLGVSADELAGSHHALVDLWGAAARGIRERLADEISLERRLDLFEAMLAARLPERLEADRLLTFALERLAGGSSPAEIARESGYSHRHLISRFREEVGVAPKVHLRLLRFQRALRLLATTDASLAAVAVDAGFSDQSHFNREFRAFAGISPGAWRRAAPPSMHHVPLPSSPPRP